MLAACTALWLTLSTAVTAAMGMPERLVLGPASSAGHPDYTFSPGQVAPLTDAFIAAALGLSAAPSETPLATAAPDGQSSPAPVLAAAPAATPSPPVGAIASRPPGYALDHAPTNDDVADALEVSGVASSGFSASTNASSATREPDEPGSCAPVGDTIWYRWTPDRHLRVLATTTGSDGITSLGVFVGDTPDDLQPHGCEHGLPGGTRLQLRALPEQTYWFQITGPAGLGHVGFQLSTIFDVVEIADPLAMTSDHLAGRRTADEAARPVVAYTAAALSADGRYAVVTVNEPVEGHDDRNDGTDVIVVDTRTGETELISRSIDGSTGNRMSGYEADITPDGRYVVFLSAASDLIHGDTNDAIDVFVHDRLGGRIERVSVDSRGREATYTYREPAPADPLDPITARLSISDDGRYVTFETELPLHPDDRVKRHEPDPSLLAHGVLPVAPTEYDAYLHDRVTGITDLVSRYEDGTPAPAWSNSAAATVSGDGTVVAFHTDAPLLPEDRDHAYDVYLRDLGTGRLELLSRPVDPGVREGEGGGSIPLSPRLSRDGRHVAFVFEGPLTADDDNAERDVFALDRRTGELRRVSQPTVPVGGQPLTTGGGADQLRGMSADGRYVLFVSTANDLFPGDEPRGGPWWYDQDVFLHDRLLRTTIMVDLDRLGEVPDLETYGGALSPDGDHVLLAGFATLADAPRPSRDGTHLALRELSRLHLHTRAVTPS